MLLLKKWHKSKTNYLILDRKKWDFQIRIILIQIKCFEQLAHNDPCHRSTNHQHLSIITQFSLYLALNKDMDPTHVNPSAKKTCLFPLVSNSASKCVFDCYTYLLNFPMSVN